MSATPPTAKRVARVSRLLLALLLVIAVSSAGLVAAAGWLASTPAGLAAIVRAVNTLTSVRLTVENPQGSLLDGFTLARLNVKVATTEVDIRDLRVHRLDFALRPPRLALDVLSAARVDVRVRPDPTTRSETPLESIAVPLAVSAGRLQVSEFSLVVGGDEDGTQIAARAIDTGVAIGPDGYHVANGGFEFGRIDAPLVAKVSGSLGGRRPFPLDATASLQSTLQDKPIAAQVDAKGSLEEFTAKGEVSGGGAGGTVHAVVAAFSAPALKELRADLHGIDPRVWSKAAPRAELHLVADLAPLAGPVFGLGGPVRIDNSLPGTVDGGRIPARSATGTARWQGARLAIADAAVALSAGSARGDFAIEFGAAPAWSTNARLAGVDPATIHARLRPMRIDGDVKASGDGGRTLVTGALRHAGEPAASLDVDLAISPQKVAVNAAHLALGGGDVDVAGEIDLTGTRRVRIDGRARQLDPSLLVSGIDARLTGDFAVDAHLEPQPNGEFQFELVDSAAFGRPVTGRGSASLSPAQQLTVDLDLAVRSARIKARGGLGAADRALDVELDAPALQELALPVSGSLSGRATLRGDWQAPSVDAQLQAKQLSYGVHRVESAQATLSYAGGSDGRLSLRAGLAQHRWLGNPTASMRAATLTAEGRPSDHTLALVAEYDVTESARFDATGGWGQGRWRGKVTQAKVGAPLNLDLIDTASVEVDRAGVRFGPARLTVAGAAMSDVQVEAGPALIATSGRFAGLRPADFFQRRQVSMLPRGPRTPLELAGNWRVRIGEAIDGEFLVERSSGDLYASSGSDEPVGVTDLRVQASVRANRAEATALVRGARLGELRAALTANVEHSDDAGWRLAQTRPWRIEAEADLPSIAWTNALLTDRVRANVRLAGALAGKLVIAGTPASPQAQGSVSGHDLRVAWIDQGVRLENGTLALHVEDDQIVLDELRFSGPPRVKPNDARTAAAMARMSPGFVAASGKLKLADLTGFAQLQAQRLPLLQRVDRWTVASGGANIEFGPKRVQVNGAVAAEAGFVDFSTPDLPTLSSDVTVVASKSAAREREPQVQFGFDLGLDLGSAFYLRGSGLSTRVAGAVRLRSEGKGIVRAAGAVTAEDGVYEGYGQKLKIARGRVNFQGPADNPGLDILALRTDLPAEAGDIGVSITRTAANPLVRLYSDPGLPDYQALSWLVLGRPADQSGGDNVALARAAVGLLAGSGEGLPSTLARELGIDEISLRSGQVGSGASLLPRQSVAGNLRGDTSSTGGSAGAEIITIGKRLNDQLSISYEAALSGAANVVQLSYRLTRRLSLIARAGTDNALDLVYSIAFD